MTHMASGEYKIRRDLIDAFVRMSDGAIVKWYEARKSFLFHASADNVTAVCNSLVRVITRGRPNVWDVEDRSNDIMSCRKCQELVRRARRGK